MTSKAIDYRATLSAALEELRQRRAEIQALRSGRNEPIAIVGMACRFPSADTPAEFWALLDRGGDAVTEVPRDRWDIDRFYDPDPAQPGKMATRFGAFLKSVDAFDPQFFNMSPREAAALDPQQKILLEVAWEALENANIAADKVGQSPVGVYIGITCFDYAIRLAQSNRWSSSYLGTGTALNMAAGRLSFVLGLTGPSMAVDTACSSSLVCLHLACGSLRAHECRMALVGGVNLMLSPEVMVGFSQARMLAPDGRCKTFDASADGYVRGEGCGVIVLKRLSDAIADGDRVLGVVRGTAVDQDGASGGLTVPSRASQERVIRRALLEASTDPREVDYVEAHGTGTSLGDPIEIEALAAVYGSRRDAGKPLITGSVKTNIGHLEPASGIAGLIKVLLSFEHDRIPAHLHFATPNPHTPWEEIPVRVADKPAEWRRGARKRIAGLSAFGFSGTTAHAIIEEPVPMGDSAAETGDEPQTGTRSVGAELLTISAKSEEALNALSRRFETLLSTASELEWPAICRAAATGRSHFAHRMAMLLLSRRKFAGREKPGQALRTAFVFAGRGTRYARELYECEPRFRESFQRCGANLLEDLDSPCAIFAVDYAWAELWKAWGVRPHAVLGVGIGEYVAAAQAGVMSLEDALRFTHLGPSEALRSVSLSAPTIQLISSATGAAASAEVSEPGYWMRPCGLRENYAGAVKKLRSLGMQILPSPRSGPSLTRGVAAMYVKGADIDWAAIYWAAKSRPTIALPNYPFQRERSRNEPPGTAIGKLLYRVVWEKQLAQAATAVEDQSIWLIFADHRGLGRQIAATLKTKDCLLAYAGPDYRWLGETELQLSPDNREHFRRVLERSLRKADTSGRLGFSPASPRELRIVFLWGLDAPAVSEITPESLERSQSETCGAALHLSQALIEAAAFPRSRIWIVTRDAVDAGPLPEVVGLAQAPLWGLAKGAAIEHPELFGSIIDLQRSASSDEAGVLLAEILGGGAEDQVAFRDGARYVPRLVADTADDELVPLRVREGGACLITGGLGALGLKTALWLVDRGARRIILAGRRGPVTDGAREAIAEMVARGASVRCEQLDIAVPAAVENLLGGIEDLCGIVHIAGVAGYRPIAGIDYPELERVLRPKVSGAWLLHDSSRRFALDFFLCFSSVASAWGSRDQAHYCAANRFLDALAHHRRAAGLPALTINWGPWAGGGMTDPDAQALLRRIGLKPLDPEEALDALDQLPDGAQITIADVDRPLFKDSYEARGRRPFLDRLHIDPRATATVNRAPAPIGDPSLLGELIEREAAEVLGFGKARLDRDQGFFEMGMDSLLALEFRRRLETALGAALPATLFFDHPNINALTRHLTGDVAKAKANVLVGRAVASDPTAEHIAVIGMGCRFPGGADNPDDYWGLLRDGVDAISEVPHTRWNIADYYDPDPEAPGKMYSRHGGFLSGIDQFDAAFFRISPREAAVMDPQQRLLLEVVHEAIEHAGIPIESVKSTQTGVFVGITTNDYAQLQMRDADSRTIDGYFFTGNPLNTAAGRVSYVLGVHGPSMAIDTACSSSLAAIHAACQSLRAGECELALAGGVNLILSPDNTIAVCRTRALAPDGRCKTFDAGADGFVRSEGCGVLVLRRLADAMAAGDRVLASIRGSAVNHDGASSGFTAPNGQAQEAVIRKALGNLPPAAIDYVEAHGTGTALGDPIEVAALAAVFGDGRAPGSKLRIGSVKSNIGHAESAAGIAGVIKVILALQREEIPAQLHFRNPSPLIAWYELPVEVCSQIVPWPRSERPRLAGVSAFGASGTNAHLILEEAPVATTGQVACGHRWHPLVLSAKSGPALKELALCYRTWLESDAGLDIASVCFSLATGRSHLRHRLGVRVSSMEDAVQKLSALSSEDTAESTSAPRIVFLFTGQGSQYAGMGRALYEAHPVFREAIDRCRAVADPLLDTPLLEAMGIDLVDQTAYCQPALYALQHALSELLKAFGIRPAAVLGHSVGEYSAACVAGSCDLEDGLRLVIERARLMQSLPRDGEMAAVFADEETVRSALHSHRNSASIAAVNGPRNVVISGARGSIAQILEVLKAGGVRSLPLNTSHAFHSPLMEPMLETFEAAARRITFRAPAIPMISNLTGAALSAAPDGEYWRRHCREAVRFADGIGSLSGAGSNVFVEIGPKPVLSSMARACRPAGSGDLFTPLISPGAEEETFVDALLGIYERGAAIDWKAFETNHLMRRVGLPSYPFQRKRSWFKEVQTPNAAQTLPPVALGPPSARVPAILQCIRGIIAQLTRADAANISLQLPFLEMGADSLVMIEAVRLIEKRYGLTLAIRRFFEDLSTIEALAEYIDANLPPDTESPAELPQPTRPAQPPPPDVPVGESALERVLIEQNRTIAQVMAQQMELLRTGISGAKPASAPVQQKANGPISEHPKAMMPWGDRVEPWARGLAPKQAAHLEELTARYTALTGKSKASVQHSRTVLADSRAAVGFRFSTKEMLYPIVGDRAAGSKLWDIDGNEYVDLTMGFGVHLFGHAPEFIQRAITDELDRSLELGARSDLVGEVATLLARISGHDRVAFSNTGTEAVMAAMRLARAVTGRDKIVMFAHSYHGHADGTLAAAGPGDGGIPAAPGVPLGSVENMIVLEYGTDAALETIRNCASALAAVMVEPVQSRNPSLQPVEFLREIRRITEEAGTALIFDEMITGFRVHPAGAQGLFGIRADIATYGKIIGGGLPLGVIAGKKRFMDAIDGGLWRYGDDSFPAAERTAFGGTFCQHPLSIAAARAVLHSLEQEGPALQARLNQRTDRLARELNRVFEDAEAPIRVAWFGSMFRFEFSTNLEPFFYHLVERGFFIWEWRTCFLSTAHSEEDLARLVGAVKESVAALVDGEFLPSRSKPAAEPKIVPLSEAQKQLWLLARIDCEGSLAYNLNTTLELRGKLDEFAMLTAVQRLADRHEALRTTISPEGDNQIIHQFMRLQIPVIGPLEADEWRRKESRQPFELTAEPLFRAALIRLGEDRHLLSLTAHHIICDGATFGVLLRDLADAYRGDGHEPAAPLQFSDYLALSEKARETPEMQAHRDYWLSQCAGSSPALNLPLDYPRPAMKTWRGARVTVQVDAEPADAIRAAARRSGCTLYMALLAGFDLLLHRITGQDELVVGVPVTGRSAPESEQLAGYCTHLLPFRSKLQSGWVVSELLTATRSALLDALDHQSYPFAELVRQIAAPCYNSASSILSVVFNLEPVSALPDIAGLELELADRVIEFTAFDLFVNVIDTGRELRIDCDFNTDLFKETTTRRLLEIYRRLLARIASDPAAKASALPLLSRSERELVLGMWNDTAAPYPMHRCLHELFEAAAAAMPARTAIIHGNNRIRFDELEHRANGIATRLSALGVEPGALIGVHARRDPNLIAALLAVLKLGCAYVPMDPAWPTARIAFMLEDAAIPFILTHRDLAQGLPASEAHTVFLDGIASENRAASAGPAASISPPKISSDSLAYVIYTSGSTGRPKGVAITHRNAVAFLHWVRDFYKKEQLRCVLAATSICFDLSVFEIFAPLSWGESLVLAEHVLELPNLPAANELTLINTVPSAMAELLRFGSLPAGVNTVNLAGEPLTQQLVRRIHQSDEQIDVYNLYGPSEDTTYSTCARMERDDPQTPTIGRPISNTRTYILDHNLQPLPVGVAGELCVGGAGLAQGYLNRPELTAERFIADPFASEPDARLYKTGDLARYRADGNIEFLGRADDQIKLRGFRIELGEIEAALCADPEVGSAVVAVRGLENNRRLVAWLIPVNARPLDAALIDSIRQRLRQRLPDYMIPSAFIAMTEFPLLPNGKIDRNRLPEAQGSAPDIKVGNHIASQLVSIWQGVLDRPAIGTADNFFEIGGNSLSAFQVVSRIRRDLNVDLEIRSIFLFPTIADLAKHVAGLRTAEYAPIVPIAPQQDYDLSPAQRRFWLHDRLNESRAGGPAPSLFLFEGALNGEALERAFETLVERHEILRSCFVAGEGQPRQKVLSGARTGFAVERIDLSGAVDLQAEIRALETRELLAPMDLSAGPLFRVKLARLAQSSHICVCTMHHIASDGWSTEILLDEFARLYDAFDRGEDDPLPALRFQFKDYTAWLNRLLAGPEGVRMKEYWLEKLGGGLPTLDFPADRDRGVARERFYRTWHLQISANEVADLASLGNRHNATLFMTMLAAIKALLYRKSGQEDIVVGSPVACRVRPELEDQVGPYLNVVALRDTVSGSERFDALLARVRQTTLEAFANQLHPLDWLHNDLKVRREAGRNPVFDVGFTLHKQRRQWRGDIAITELPSSENQPIYPEAMTRLWFLATPQNDGGVDMSIIYDGKLFSQSAMQRLAEDLKSIIYDVIAQPGVRIHGLRLSHASRPPEPAKIAIELEI
jgi:amino acid adenylation domain-containing protein